MKIIKNILSKKELTTFKGIVLSDDFPWYYNHKSAYEEEFFKKKKEYKNIYEHTQFTHKFIERSAINSKWLEQLSSIFDKIYKGFDIKEIIRLKLNYQPQYNSKKTELYNTPHEDAVDYGKEYNTILFYLNTCDGHTYFFNNKKVIKKIKSIENSLVQFEGNLLHGGSHPKKDKRRLVLNINYI